MTDIQQGVLWSETEYLPTVADRCLAHFATRFLEGAKACGDDMLPRALDEAAFACVLLCEAYQAHVTVDHTPLLQACCQALMPRPFARLDMLPFSLCLALLRPRADITEMLTRHFANGQSSTRFYAMELGWLLRRHLTREACAPVLLKNVADTLSGWVESLALCSALFPDEDAFWAGANAFDPEPRFADQFKERLARAKEFGLGACRVHFTELESTLRQILTDHVMALRCHGLHG